MMKTCSEVTQKILMFLNLPNIGVSKLRKIIAKFDDPLDDVDAILKYLQYDHSIVMLHNASDAKQKIIEECVKHDIGIVSPFDEMYPKKLREITDYPPLLYYKGNIENCSIKCAAVIGTRKPSEYGEKVAFRISRFLSENNICIVSGLAIGVDTAAHRGAIESRSKTVAILAHGLDIIHPPNNISLAEEILQCDGTLISEHPPGYKIYRTEFVKRNRIQSGISTCSIIVESGESGGSIRQAEYTFRQNRKMFVVMQDKITASSSDYNMAGSLYLMDKYKATAIRNRNDLNEVLQLFELKE